MTNGTERLLAEISRLEQANAALAARVADLEAECGRTPHPSGHCLPRTAAREMRTIASAVLDDLLAGGFTTLELAHRHRVDSSTITVWGKKCGWPAPKPGRRNPADRAERYRADWELGVPSAVIAASASVHQWTVQVWAKRYGWNRDK